MPGLTKQPYAIRDYSPKQDAKAYRWPAATWSSGLNNVEGKIIMHTLDGQVIALHANTGKELLESEKRHPAKGETIRGWPGDQRQVYRCISVVSLGVRCTSHGL